jgi:hypothetical protein
VCAGSLTTCGGSARAVIISGSRGSEHGRQLIVWGSTEVTEIIAWWEHCSKIRIDLRRAGRYLVVDLRPAPGRRRSGWRVDDGRSMSGQPSELRGGHLDRHQVITETGLDGYHDRVCAEADVPADGTAVMGTAANMNYVAIIREVDEDVAVTAAVTAGVEGNATAAGEPATWRENDAGVQKVPAYAGTINTMLFISRPARRWRALSSR